MSRIYFYKLTTDDGGAPCVQGRLLSLAICKPMLRKTAEPGDWIFGFAANSLHKDNRLIYIAEVSRKILDGAYYTDTKYAGRDDRIYKKVGGRFVWRTGALHHGPDHVAHDLGKYPVYERSTVVLSARFRYFGANGTADYKDVFPVLRTAVERLGRGHRIKHDGALREALMQLRDGVFRTTSQSVLGRPASRPNRARCHRGRTCGVV